MPTDLCGLWAGHGKKTKRTPNSISSGSRIAGAGPKRPKLHHNPTHLPPTATLCASTLSSKTQRQTWIIINTSFVAIRFRCIELNQQQRISLEIPTTESSPCSDDSTSGKRRIYFRCPLAFSAPRTGSSVLLSPLLLLRATPPRPSHTKRRGRIDNFVLTSGLTCYPSCVIPPSKEVPKEHIHCVPCRSVLHLKIANVHQKILPAERAQLIEPITFPLG